jgi:hypothetical protein
MDAAGSVTCPLTSGFSIITDDLSDSATTKLFYLHSLLGLIIVIFFTRKL